MESVVSQIRSVLISTKGKSDLRQLQKDYKMLMGEDIPYRKLGYPNLESFIKNVPSLTISQGPNGLIVEAIPSNKTKHMVQLINKQRTAKKKSSGRLPPRYNSRYNSAPRYIPQKQQWRAPYVDRARPRPHVHQIVVSVNNTSSSSDANASLQQRLVRNICMVPSPPLPVQPHTVENMPRKNPRLSRSVSSPQGGSASATQQRQERPRIAETVLRRISNYISVQREKTPLLPSPTPSTPPVTAATTLTTVTPSLPTETPGGHSLGVRAQMNNDARPRMRLNNLTILVSPPPPLGPCGPRHPAPSLSKTEIDTLMKEAVAEYNSASTVWRWPSSDESSPQRSDSDNTPPKNELPKQPSPIARRNSESAAPARPTYFAETEEFKRLKEFAVKYELGDVQIRILPRASKKLRATEQLYDCSIKIDNQSFSSYPRDCCTTAEAEAEASRQALIELSARYTEDRRNRKYLLATEQDVLTKLPPIIEQHFHGIWATQLAADYEEKYNRHLPPNWLALLDTLPTISVEPTLDNRYVLKLCKIGEKNIKTENLNQISNQHLSTEVSVPSNKIKLTEEGWLVEVTYVASTVEVWCRIVDSEDSNKYCEINAEMQNYYSKFGGKEQAANVSAGGFYVVQFENCWSRVRVLATGGRDVTCFFIDFGDEQVVSRSDMYDLKRDYAKVQAQAFVCRLSGLEELANMKAAPTRLAQIASKTYLAKPQVHEMEKPDGPEAISIVLYDCGNSDDGDVVIESEEDVNRLLIRQITNDSVPSLDPHNINRVYLTHVTDKGDFYVQPHCEAFNKINELITALNDVDFDAEFPGQHIPSTPEEDGKRLYLARWTHIGGDGNLYRCRVVDRSPCGQYVQLHFIDYGNTQIINYNSGNVYPLEKISEVLMAFPPLANRVRLNVELKLDRRTGEESGFAKKAMQLMPSEQIVLLKIINSTLDEEGQPVPVCEMFRRSGSRNELTSVSASLQYGRGENGVQEDTSEDGNNNDKTTQLAKRLERLRFTGFPDNKPVPSTGELAAPDLPDPGSFLDVRVPFAVNPWNFFVQPYNSAGELLQLMEQLQERYGGERRLEDRINVEDVIPGKIYAAKHTDGVWYRTSVIKIINFCSISVFYCDVGYYANLTVEQLLPLDPEFLTLPYQAIKARLAGIKPLDDNWSIIDCQNFERLVRMKNFVSVVVAVQQDEFYKCDAVLVLRLIDTSTDRDIHVDKLLIEEGIAAQAPAN